MNRKVLFVDDQPSARELFERLLGSEYEVAVAGSIAEAEAALAGNRPDVIVTDLRMPECDGLTGMERFRRADPDLPVIVVTAFGGIETAVEAMRRGAFDYVSKPFEAVEIGIAIDRAFEHLRLVRENARLRLEVAGKLNGEIIAESRAIRTVMDLVSRAAPTDLSVLIQGASGTGKDLLARAIHTSSRRAKNRFVSINCSAIPEHLLESELFGHEKGAFTGATHTAEGFFTKADGGTLFLDEVGDMSLTLQPKLLRALQNGEFYPVGGRQLKHADVRIVCASNQNIPRLIEERRFREDLYYRINTVSIVLPPLRERPEDIPLLAEFFLARLQQKEAKKRVLTPQAMRCLLEFGWPGNIRELEHALARALLVCDGQAIHPEHLAPEIRGFAGSEPPRDQAPLSYRDAKVQFERAFLIQLLERAGGNVQKAADLAGLHRTTLYEKLEKAGIQPPGHD